MKYQIELEIFEGPMDLLLSLIKEKEIDIYDIPIGYLTEEYLKHMDEMERLDLNISTEFVLMAATLLEIKSRTLLPKKKNYSEDEEPEEDPRQELTDKLIEYKLLKEAAENLKMIGEKASKVYYRNSEEFAIFSEDDSYEDLDSGKLLKALDNILKRLVQKEKAPGEIRKEDFSTAEAMEILLREVENKNSLKFTELLDEDSTVVEVLTYFLALLELMRLFKVYAKQSGEDILILRYGIEGNKG